MRRGCAGKEVGFGREALRCRLDATKVELGMKHAELALAKR
jgi:hypothetical protein